MGESYMTYEALEWLKSNNSPSALASNRFGKTINAINFVEKLYELGAKKVSVFGIMDEPERVKEEGGAYATTLLVELPDNIEKREGVLKLYEKEMEEETFNEGDESLVNNTIAFWWD